jgi:diaminohydroxyphosphoribosylaminopyrimidine deaminase/5-amino-6-(5-phosphoribosylamino)uracil reductase
MTILTPMQQALNLANKARGSTSPNPSVGAVIVKDNNVVGQGHTLPAGQEHAEIVALQQAGSLAKGATLYVTLEPCCHYGRTPPCTEAIIKAGLKTVYVAALDPNPKVTNQGIQILTSAGIETIIDTSVNTHELYEAFSKHIKTHTPFTIAKFAMSLDGKIATHNGDSKWITGDASRALVHGIRKISDAIMVGVNTVISDDPQLTARDENNHPLDIQPVRIILDSHGRTPPNSKIFSEKGRVLIYVCDNCLTSNINLLESAGAEVIIQKPDSAGRVDLYDVINHLGKLGIVTLLVESGGTLLGSLFDRDLIDKIYAFTAPIIIGGKAAPSPIEGEGSLIMSHVWHITDMEHHTIGNDWLVVGYPNRRP